MVAHRVVAGPLLSSNRRWTQNLCPVFPFALHRTLGVEGYPQECSSGHYHYTTGVAVDTSSVRPRLHLYSRPYREYSLNPE